MTKANTIISAAIAAACVFVIIVLATGVWRGFLYPQEDEFIRTRVITPREVGEITDAIPAGRTLWEESMRTYVPMQDGENIIAVLTIESYGSITQEQFVAYQNINGASNQIYLAWISIDPITRRYRRMWDTPTVATRAETVSLFSQDLIGDRNSSIILSGMNDRNEHTLTIFRRHPTSTEAPLRRIAEFQVDGSIVIQETARSLAYRQGIARGESFTIATYVHDAASDNILDQLQLIYSFNPHTYRYERTGTTRIPGSRVEQLRIREILSGEPGVFENFINDLWFFVTPQGTIDRNVFIYFNPNSREILFFNGENQRIYRWLSSTPTRYGLYVRGQNRAIRTLRRSIAIEVVSLDSIRLRIREDVRLLIMVPESWDGIFQRARITSPVTQPPTNFTASAVYDSPWGRIEFHDCGKFVLNPGGGGTGVAETRTGRYVFFDVGDQNLLELRPDEPEYFITTRIASNSPRERFVFQVEAADNDTRRLTRVRLGVGRVQNMFEPPVLLTPVSES